jgi:hypothetical protein
MAQPLCGRTSPLPQDDKFLNKRLPWVQLQRLAETPRGLLQEGVEGSVQSGEGWAVRTAFVNSRGGGPDILRKREM